MSALVVGGRMEEAKQILNSSWKSGVVRHVSVGEASRMWMLVAVPFRVVRVMVRPVAPLPRLVRRSAGMVVRCSRQVAGRRVNDPSPKI